MLEISLANLGIAVDLLTDTQTQTVLLIKVICALRFIKITNFIASERVGSDDKKYCFYFHAYCI